MKDMRYLIIEFSIDSNMGNCCGPRKDENDQKYQEQLNTMVDFFKKGRLSLSKKVTSIKDMDKKALFSEYAGTMQKYFGSINFKKIGVKSMDTFFQKCSTAVSAIKDIVNPLTTKKKEFMKITGFDLVPGADLSNAFLGLFCAMVAAADGDVDKLQVQYPDEVPFISFNGDCFSEKLSNQYHAFMDYIMSLNQTVKEKLPEALNNVEELQEAAEKARQESKEDFELLGDQGKGIALTRINENMSQIKNIPNLVTSSIESLRADLQLLMQTVHSLRDNIGIIKDAGSMLAEQKEEADPVKCYKIVYGDIEVTPDLLAAWEKAREEHSSSNSPKVSDKGSLPETPTANADVDFGSSPAEQIPQ